MKYKKVKLIAFIFIFTLSLITSIIIYLSASSFCKTTKIFNSLSDFGISQIEGCFSLYETKQSVKRILREYPALYTIALNFKNEYVQPFKLNLPPNNADELNKINLKKKKIPNKIIGLVNKKYQKKNSIYKDLTEVNFKQWNRSHGDNYNSKFFNDNSINLNNINNLKLYWKHSNIKEKDLNLFTKKQNHSPNVVNVDSMSKSKWRQNIEVNPVFLNGKLIYVTPDWKIICLDIEKKKVLWELQTIFPPSRRGILAYKKDNKEYLVLPVGGKIYKIDLITGKRIKTFGNNGSVNATTITSPIVDLESKNLIIVNHIKKFVHILDIQSGKTKKIIPLFDKKGENWSGGSPWAGIAYDDINKLLYVPTGNPHPSLYGVKRPGNNLGSSSLIAIDIKNYKIIWTFQEVFHDLWDYDLAFPPFIDDILIDNNLYNIVSLVAKTGNNILLERFTGKPIFNIDFQKTTPSIVDGEIASNYQIKIETPEKLSKIEYNNESFSELSDQSQLEIKKKIMESQTGKFTPPSFSKDTILFGLHGGGEWQGGSMNPFEDAIYVPVNNVPWKVRPYFYSTSTKLNFKDDLKEVHKLYLNKCSSCHKKNRNGIYNIVGEKEIKKIPSLVGLTYLEELNKNLNYKNFIKKHKEKIINEKEFNSIKKLFLEWDNQLIANNRMRVQANGLAWSQFLTEDGLHASNPPWGYVVKQSLKTGKIIWKTPVGYNYEYNKISPTGTSIFGGTALNSGNILFVTGTYDKMFYALNTKNGKILWEYQMNAAGSAPPTIFKHKDKQYVAVVSTGGAYFNYKEKDSAIYIFALN